MIFVERHDRPSPTPPTAIAGELEGAERLDFPSARRLGWRVTLHRKADRYNGFVQWPKGWLHVASPLGLDCFAVLRKILADAPVTGLQRALDALEHIRPCAFVAYDTETEALHFGRSMDGFGSMYFGGERERLIVSDSRLRVARAQGEVRLSEADREEWCARAVISPEGSFFEGVKRCFAGIRYASALGVQFAYRVMAPEGEPLSQEASVRFLEDGLLEAFADYGDRRVALTLSGGIDSRTLLVGMLEAVRRGILRMDQILCVSVGFPGLDCDESDIVREVAHRAGVELHLIEATRDRVEAAIRQGLSLEAPQFPTAFIHVLCATAARDHGAELLCGGFGGDEVLDYGYTDLLDLPFPERLRDVGRIARERVSSERWHRIKILAAVVLGRRALRHLHRNLGRFPFRASLSAAYRLGQRFAIAEGAGYELAATAAGGFDLASDAPFFRAPLFGRLAPARTLAGRNAPFKPVAQGFMQRRLPGLAAIPSDKVEFSAAVNRWLLPFLTGKCDEFSISPKESLRCATKQACDAWVDKLGNRPRGVD